MPRSIAQATRGRVYIGIDPGASGGIAILEAGEVQWLDLKDKTEIDILKWSLDKVSEDVYVMAMLEKVHSMPGQGVASSFKFGQSYGSLRMLLAASGCVWEDVTPQKWMMGLNIPMLGSEENYDQRKKRLRGIAQRLFPTIPLWDELVGCQKNVCDALLIALYCQRKDLGQL